MHGRREEFLVRYSALCFGESHTLDPRRATRTSPLPLLSARDAAGNGVRVQLDCFSRRSLAMLLRIHVSGTSSPALPGLRLHTVCRALPSVRGNDETPRGFMNERSTYRPRSADAREMCHLPLADHRADSAALFSEGNLERRPEAVEETLRRWLPPFLSGTPHSTSTPCARPHREPFCSQQTTCG